MAIPVPNKWNALAKIVVFLGMLLFVGAGARAESIDDAVAHVKEMVRSGASRYDIGQWVSKKLDARIKNLNSPWEGWVLGASEDERKAFIEWRNKGVFSYDAAAKWAWEKRIGQCEEQACSAYYILNKGGVPGRLQIVGTLKHAFVVWGMAQNADISNEKTWGRDAVIVDGWLGSASKLEPEFRTRVGSTVMLSPVYWGGKRDYTPAYVGNLVIGGPWNLVINWKNATKRKDKTMIESKMLIKQIGDVFDGEIAEGQMKVLLKDGRIFKNGVIRFSWSVMQFGGVGLFRFTDKEARLFDGQYNATINFEGDSYTAIIPFTGEVNARTITLFPQDPIVKTQ